MMKINKRRNFLSQLGLSSLVLFTTGLTSKKVEAHHTDTHFEKQSDHKLVYQLNKADHQHVENVLFSCGEMLRKYGDDIELVISTFGPGIHLLATRPKRAISRQHQQRVQSLIEYGVRFQVCGNTMKSMHWVDTDIIANVQIVPVGVDGIMQLQEQGFSYISM